MLRSSLPGIREGCEPRENGGPKRYVKHMVLPKLINEHQFPAIQFRSTWESKVILVPHCTPCATLESLKPGRRE